MTQEEKQLLLSDICARLPYGPKCKFFYTENKKSACGIGFLETEISFENIEWFLSHKDDFVDVKPYLRPMSSMTEDEEYEYDNLITYECNDEEGICFSINNFDKLLDWFNRKMFDYRGLIPMGLALEAPEGMYKTT